MDGYRVIPDGKPYSKGEKGWYKPDGQEWMLWESTIDGNCTTPTPATAPFSWKRIREDEEK